MMQPMHLVAEPLRAESFGLYGDVLEAPLSAGRTYFDGGLFNGRPGAIPSLSISHVPPLTSLPLVATKMERHEFSSQSFVPLDAGRWFVIVAPKALHGGPDAAKARAFLAGPGQGVTYRAGTWHHPMSVLDRPARFAVFMWLEKESKTDEEFFTLETPFTVGVPA